jgi:hypothetical protein
MSQSITHNDVNKEFFLTLLTGSMALRFTATGVLFAARRIRILPMNHHA